jgi:hypothetical protein
MACNLPVVSVDVGDVKACLRGVRGCVVVNGSPEAIAAGLEDVLLTRERSDGRAHIRDLTSSVVADQLISLYQRVSGGLDGEHQPDMSRRRAEEQGAARRVPQTVTHSAHDCE